MSKGSYEEVGEYIKSCGLYKTKAKSLVEMSKMICEKFGGEVPATLEDLITLPVSAEKPPTSSWETFTESPPLWPTPIL